MRGLGQFSCRLCVEMVLSAVLNYAMVLRIKQTRIGVKRVAGHAVPLPHPVECVTSQQPRAAHFIPCEIFNANKSVRCERALSRS